MKGHVFLQTVLGSGPPARAQQTFSFLGRHTYTWEPRGSGQRGDHARPWHAWQQEWSLLRLQKRQSFSWRTRGHPVPIFFGAGAATILVARHAMAKHDLLPNNLLFVHFLWAFMFMCLYPKNGKDPCACIGGPNPNTVWTKTWPFIFTLYCMSWITLW